MPVNYPGKTPYLVVVNPNAGIRKGERDWPLIKKLLEAFDLDFAVEITRQKGHAEDIVAQKLEEGFLRIIAVGGDGTMNEILNGVFRQRKIPSTEITLGMITVGTGNDWGKTYGIPKDYAQAIETISEGVTFVQDVGKIVYSVDGMDKSRYFINNTGIGFDGLVAARVNVMKEQGKGGKLMYLGKLISGLMSYKSGKITLKVDEVVRCEDLFSLSIGICKYNGNGMMQLPHAIPDDGLLDATMIKSLSKTDVIINVKNLYDGSFLSHPRVETFRGRVFRVEAEVPMMIEADGETLGNTPCSYSILPAAINVIVNKNFKVK